MTDELDNNTDEKKGPTHFVGIGASAGGLEALQDVFGNMPIDTGAAFVVVQHLSPDYKSMMPELLSRHTQMPIHEVTDGMVIEANNVYLMPARKNMLIAEGKLLLADQVPDTHPQMPIDFFLRSLAEDQQHKAVGVVLSGTGSDGTRGIKAMKEAGGLVMVQEPGSAKFDGMPMSAYSTGLADILLPAKEMGESLQSFFRHPSISGQSTLLKPFTGNESESLDEIFKLLRRQSSINFSQYKASTVARRIERRLGINQLTTLESYLRLLFESPKELQILSKELLIGVTRFFRDDEIFSKLEKDIIPRIAERSVANGDPIRIWVAGCSSGEEAYSIAMLIDEYLNEHSIEARISIFATDIDDDSIAEASAGVYPLDISLDISESRLKRYFLLKDEHYVVSQQLREMVIFASHNLLEDPPFSNIDLVTCRNVLIYFQYPAQKKVLSSLFFALKRNGTLWLGPSESLGDLQSHFETIEERSKLYEKISNQRIPVGSSPPALSGVMAAAANMMPPVSPFIKAGRATSRNSFDSVLERLIVEYAPDCIVLNDVFDAVHVYGNVSAYIKPLRAGKVSNNIKDIIIDDLAVAISTALYRCEKNQEDVFYQDIGIRHQNGEESYIDLSIFYVKEKERTSAPAYYILQFIGGGKAPLDRVKVSFDAGEQSRQRIQDLELELLKKQEHLQVTVEELETTNEELQSANEELMSANEELQSTNEELQSVNEELYTVNSEYQEKIAELTEANDDLDSVINATNIGIVFLDESLSIRKFTPVASNYIHLRAGDVGRPFHHISHELEYDEMFNDIAYVSSQGDSIEKAISSTQEHSLLIRILPYQNSGGTIQAGVVITITNISRQKFVESALERAQDQLRSVLLESNDSSGHLMSEHNNVRVLLLDDDRVDRKRIKRLLSNVPGREFEISHFDRIDAALAAVEESSYDICLVDYRLAEGTAKEFAAGMRDSQVSTPIILLSGYSQVEIEMDLLEADVFDFLNKDELSSQLLIRSIDYVLERKQMQQAVEELDSGASQDDC